MKRFFQEYGTTLGLIWIGSALIFVFAFMLFLKPQLQTKKKLAKQAAKLKQEYQQASGTLNEMARGNFEKELAMLKDRVDEFVTDSDGTANLTFDISRIAGKNKVSAFSIKGRNNLEVSKIEGCQTIGESKIDVDFESGFEQFARFVNALERHMPVIFIDDFSIERGRKKGENSRVAMTLAVFVQKRQDG
ncbi:MAG: hypothetical protein JW804_02680 [Sedimentisphaerales bacterium]|nr:hypothetical protein [Sedimentisphaerales bacterium]